MRRKKIKLQNLDAELRSQSADNPRIFRGVVVQVNGYTQPSLNDLHHLVVSHGGGFLQYLDGKTAVTHIIASSLTPKKRVDFARYRIVKPAWVVDSVKAGRLLPWDAYRVVDEGVGQKVLGFAHGQIVSQTNTQRSDYRDQTDTSWYMSQLKGTAREGDGDAKDSQIKNIRCEHDLDIENLEKEDLGLPVDDGQLSPGPYLSNIHDPHKPESIQSEDNDDLHKSTRHDHQETVISHDHDVPRKNPEERERRDMEASWNTYSEAEKSSAIATSYENHELRIRPVLNSDATPEKVHVTAEEHNRILLADPHMAKSSTANPDFLNQYYRESRLHHLSSWKADLKSQLQARAQERTTSQKRAHKRAPGTRRYILHIDFDSFFAAVSLRRHPQLAEKPVAIAHGSGAGSEIASCNYPARKYGVKNGMWMKTALQLCPDIKILPYDFKAYEEASRHFYDAILATDGIVQSVSIDEALVDISQQCIDFGGSDGRKIQEGSIYREQAKADEVAQDLRKSIKDKTGCEVSVGIGNNILLAKVALRKAKPAGQHQIRPEEVLDFLAELTVTDLPGVAHSTSSKLEEIGVKYVKDIRNLNKERLINSLGPKTGEKIWDYARGIDKLEVGEQVIRKSVSAEVNWGIRFITQQQAEDFVQCLCDELSRRLLEQSMKGRQLTMKIMRRAADAPMDPPKNLGHGKCDTFNKSIVLGVATNDRYVIGKEALSIMRGYGFSPGELRGLGVQMQKLEPLKPSSSVSVALDSSQRRLQFRKTHDSPESASSPTRQSDTSLPADRSLPTPPIKTKLKNRMDPIEDVLTPEKPLSASSTVRHTGGVSADSTDNPRLRLLNTSGTQFVLPSQTDPAVLAELPHDVRAKLVPHQEGVDGSFARLPPSQLERNRKTQPASPLPSAAVCDLPSQSQLDPETLSELPADVRKEVMAQYDPRTGKIKATNKNQQLLPQSPRKAKPVFTSKKGPITPTKRQKFIKVVGKGKQKSGQIHSSTLTQSNFVAMPNEKAGGSAVEDHSTDQEISALFLAELPEDIRREILLEQRRNRLKSKAGLKVSSRRRPEAVGHASEDGLLAWQKRLRLPARPDRPTFTSRKLSTLRELREAMIAWVEEFSGEAEEGPYDEDADALVSYLEKVISVESDIEKAVSVVDWVTLLVEDTDFTDAAARVSWRRIVRRLRVGVQAAVSSRGLPPVLFHES